MPQFKEEVHTYKVSYMPPGENKLKDKEVQGNSVAQVMHIVNKAVSYTHLTLPTKA